MRPQQSHLRHRAIQDHASGAGAEAKYRARIDGQRTPWPRVRPWKSYPTHIRAFRNRRIHGPSSVRPGGRQESCTARKTRSGWGIRMVTRPSGVVSAVMPPGEPLGFSG